MILVYGDKARLWDLATGEFRRSAPIDKVDEMKGAMDVAWREWLVILSSHRCSEVFTKYRDITITPSPSMDALQVLNAPTSELVSGTKHDFSKHSCPHAEVASTLILDINTLIQRTLRPAATGASKDQPGGALDTLRGALSLLLTPGLNEEIDRICETKLGISRSRRNVGQFRHGAPQRIFVPSLMFR